MKYIIKLSITILWVYIHTYAYLGIHIPYALKMSFVITEDRAVWPADGLRSRLAWQGFRFRVWDLGFGV